MYFIFKLPRLFILLIIAGKNIFFYIFSFIVTFHLYRTPCLNEMLISGNRSIKVRFRIIGRVSIFLHNFAISGAILLIFSLVVEIEECYILSYLILKMKQNGDWKTKMKKYNFYSFAFMHTKRISLESTILAWFRNISFLTYTHFS